jgi:hypothetical protein
MESKIERMKWISQEYPDTRLPSAPHEYTGEPAQVITNEYLSRMILELHERLLILEKDHEKAGEP